MSQLESNPYAGEVSHVEPKTSGLAITALVFSFVFFCPLTTLLGPLLGLVAAVMIGNNPAKKGKGIAVFAIILGLVATAGQVIVTVTWVVPMYEKMAGPQQVGPHDQLLAGFAGDYDGFRTGLYGPAASATDEEIKVFVDTLRERYGEFMSSTMDEQKFNQDMGKYLGNLMSPEKTFPYLLQFDSGSVEAEVQFSMQDMATGQQFWETRFSTIHIMDADKGDLVFPSP